MITDSRGRARIGVLVPFTNTNLEPDLTMLRPPGVSLHYARLGGYDMDAIPDAAEMAGLGAADMSEPLRLLAGTKPDLIVYGCTSATLAHGPRFDRELSKRILADTGAATVTAAGALAHALDTLAVKRIGFASPYVPSLNDNAVAFLAQSGFETVARADVEGELDNHGQGALTPDEVFELGLRADHEHAQALVLSCTDMRSVETVERLEAAIKKPVVTSNQALMFAALDALGLSGQTIPCGTLMRKQAVSLSVSKM